MEAPWMRDIEVGTNRAEVDRAMTFRVMSDPECFHQFLGEQVRPCVYRPTAVFAENWLELHDDVSEADPETKWSVPRLRSRHPELF